MKIYSLVIAALVATITAQQSSVPQSEGSSEPQTDEERIAKAAEIAKESTFVGLLPNLV